ncbi:MAG: LuxR C-terminal-related transcriptional regulator, partial [Thermomicrobiales bacterium]|nr:LuxR C-terminal-related transcriptional regulator [Thermomicrobiales bacterium]
IGDALATGLQRERTEGPSTSLEQPSGVLILAPDSEPTFSTPAADEMLSALHDTDARTGAHLPSPVAAAVAGLRANGKPRQQVMSPTPLGLIAIEASSGGSDGSVAVVLTLQRPTGPPTVPADWPLTPQEREVVQRLISGDSNRAIAEALFITENTVQTHLRNIYGKLEVTSRNQLLARLFHGSA